MTDHDKLIFVHEPLDILKSLIVYNKPLNRQRHKNVCEERITKSNVHCDGSVMHRIFCKNDSAQSNCKMKLSKEMRVRISSTILEIIPCECERFCRLYNNNNNDFMIY